MTCDDILLVIVATVNNWGVTMAKEFNLVPQKSRGNNICHQPLGKVVGGLDKLPHHLCTLVKALACKEPQCSRQNRAHFFFLQKLERKVEQKLTPVPVSFVASDTS